MEYDNKLTNNHFLSDGNLFTPHLGNTIQSSENKNTGIKAGTLEGPQKVPL